MAKILLIPLYTMVQFQDSNILLHDYLSFKNKTVLLDTELRSLTDNNDSINILKIHHTGKKFTTIL